MTVTSTLAGKTFKSQTVAVPGQVAVVTLQTGTPALSGKAVHGAMLTAAPGAWTNGTVLKYRWQRNGVTIPHAYGAKYQVRTADRNTKTIVEVTGTLAGYTTESGPAQPSWPADATCRRRMPKENVLLVYRFD